MSDLWVRYNIVICSAECLNEHHTTQYLISITAMIIGKNWMQHLSEETLLNFSKATEGLFGSFACHGLLCLAGQ